MAVTIGPANRHESTRLIDVMEDVMKNITGKDGTPGICQVHADAGYNTETIRRYPRARMIEDCTIPRRRTKKKRSDKSRNGKGRCNAVRYVVERFFSWPKNGFARLRIRHGRRSENYLSCVCQHRVIYDVFQSIGMSSSTPVMYGPCTLAVSGEFRAAVSLGLAP